MPEPTSRGLLIRRAEVSGRGPVDVRIAGSRIVAIGPALDPASGEPTLDAAGAALIPGLHDHHLHLLALAAAQRSVRCGPPAVRDRAGLERALRNAQPDPDTGWIRGTGYHDAVAGPLCRGLLDGLRPDRPMRIQHRSGALWGINSAGLRLLDLDPPPASTPAGVERAADGGATGRLLRVDTWLRLRLGSPPAPPLAAVGRRLARAGVTGVTDATPHNGASELAILCGAVADGALPQRLQVMGTPELPVPQQRGVQRGAVKLWLADSDLPPFDALRDAIADAHARGRPVAIHCVTRAELVLAADALGAAGALRGDRVEHAAVAPPELVARLAALPVAVVTQPNFVRERGDAYLDEVDAGDRPWLYRGRGFLRAGIPLGGGTDAPFGEPEPWHAMAAAVDRHSAGGAALGPGEALTPERALALFTTPLDDPGGPPRSVAIGAVADLCLLDRPWRRARERLDEVLVSLTLCRGEPVWRA